MKSQFNILLLFFTIFSLFVHAQESPKKRDVPLFKPKFFGDNITISSQDNVGQKEKQKGVSFDRDIRICSGVYHGQKVITLEVTIQSGEARSIYNVSVGIILDQSLVGLLTLQGKSERYVGMVSADTPTAETFVFRVNDANYVLTELSITFQLSVPGQQFSEKHSLKLPEQDCW